MNKREEVTELRGSFCFDFDSDLLTIILLTTTFFFAISLLYSTLLYSTLLYSTLHHTTTLPSLLYTTPHLPYIYYTVLVYWLCGQQQLCSSQNECNGQRIAESPRLSLALGCGAYQRRRFACWHEIRSHSGQAIQRPFCRFRNAERPMKRLQGAQHILIQKKEKGACCEYMIKHQEMVDNGEEPDWSPRSRRGYWHCEDCDVPLCVFLNTQRYKNFHKQCLPWGVNFTYLLRASCSSTMRACSPGVRRSRGCRESSDAAWVRLFLLREASVALNAFTFFYTKGRLEHRGSIPDTLRALIGA